MNRGFMSFNLRLAPLCLFALFSIKLLILGGSFADSAILGVLALAMAYFDYKATDKDIQNLQNQIKNQQNDLDLLRKEQQDLRDRLSNYKLGQQLKPVK